MVIISNSELEIIKVLWDKSPLTAPQVVEALRDKTEWEENTIKTLLTRLVKKGAVTQSGRKRSYMFAPAVGRDEYRLQAVKRFLGQLFDSDVQSLKCFCVQNGKLDSKDIEQLQKLLEEKAQ